MRNVAIALFCLITTSICRDWTKSELWDDENAQHECRACKAVPVDNAVNCPPPDSGYTCNDQEPLRAFVLNAGSCHCQSIACANRGWRLAVNGSIVDRIRCVRREWFTTDGETVPSVVCIKEADIQNLRIADIQETSTSTETTSASTETTATSTSTETTSTTTVPTTSTSTETTSTTTELTTSTSTETTSTTTEPTTSTSTQTTSTTTELTTSTSTETTSTTTEPTTSTSTETTSTSTEPTTSTSTETTSTTIEPTTSTSTETTSTLTSTDSTTTSEPTTTTPPACLSPDSSVKCETFPDPLATSLTQACFIGDDAWCAKETVLVVTVTAGSIPAYVPIDEPATCNSASNTYEVTTLGREPFDVERVGCMVCPHMTGSAPTSFTGDQLPAEYRKCRVECSSGTLMGKTTIDNTFAPVNGGIGYYGQLPLTSNQGWIGADGQIFDEDFYCQP